MKAIRAAALALAAAVLAGCAAERPSGVPEYYSGNFAQARQIYADNLAAEKNSRALYMLRLGTLELDRGNLAEARGHFIEASAIMQDFTASGEFKALVGSESSKEYKGDPYEQMMALWYLGLLDYMSGDYGKALPSFRSAALADGGTTVERYRSDAASVFFMMAEAYRALGDDSKARGGARRGRGSLPFPRNRRPRDRGAFRRQRRGRKARRGPAAVDAAYGFLSGGASAGATLEQDPVRALDAARGYADEALANAAEENDRAALLDQDPNARRRLSARDIPVGEGPRSHEGRDASRVASGGRWSAPPGPATTTSSSSRASARVRSSTAPASTANWRG